MRSFSRPYRLHRFIFAVYEAAQAGVVLGPDSDTISDSDITFGFRANPDGNADEFMAHDTRVIGRSM